MRKHSLIAFAVAIATALALANSAPAAIIYTTAGTNYTQSFDTLPVTPRDASLGNSPVGWTNDNGAPGAGNFSIVGFYLYHPLVLAEGGFDSHQRMRVGQGAANTGAFMSYGATGATAGASSTERAFGSLASNTTANPVGTLPPAVTEQYLGMRVTNNTGATLGSFTLTYNGEQWRDGGAAVPNAQTLTVGYKQTVSGAGPLLQDSGFTAMPTATFTSPVFANTGAGTNVDGNVAGRVNNITATVTGLTWLANTDLWIRWTDLSDIGNDHGLAIDDLKFSAQLANVAPIIVDYVDPTPINASDPGSYSHLMTAIDPDVPPQTLTWSGVTLGSYTPAFGGAGGLAVLPTISPTGMFDWNTVGSARGYYTFNVSVNDGNGGSDNGTITIGIDAVPEPASFVMLVLGMVAAIGLKRNR